MREDHPAQVISSPYQVLIKSEEPEMARIPAPGNVPASYLIEKLLSSSVQPFPDLPAEEFDALVQSIRDRGMLHPIQLTSDGYLWDGHQRLKAQLVIGRTRISAKQVEVNPRVTRSNMLGYALASNLCRRFAGSEDKADRMHKCAAIGWSQRRIAGEFHVSQPAVSQLMAKYPPAEGTPEIQVTEGADGKTYVTPRREKTGKAEVAKWGDRGVSGKLVTRLQAEAEKLSRTPVSDIDAERCDGLTYALAKTTDALASVRQHVELHKLEIDGATALRRYLLTEVFADLGRDELTALLNMDLDGDEADRLAKEYDIRRASVLTIRRNVIQAAIKMLPDEDTGE
jgi:hypothetical protein